jgi:hypothetical protein
MLQNNLTQLAASGSSLAPATPGSPGATPPQQPEPGRDTADPVKEPEPAGAAILEAQKHLKEAIAQVQEKIDTLEAMGKNFSVTTDSRSRLIEGAKALADMSRRSLTMLDVQKHYWESFYEMRYTQVLELCGRTQIPGPLRIPIPH